MNKIAIISIALLGIFSSCVSNQTSQTSQTIDKIINTSIIPTNEYEIYSTVLLFDNPKNKVVIRQTTANITYCFDINYCFNNFENSTQKRLDKDLINDFKMKNLNNIYKLENKFSIPQRVILISESELNYIFQKPNWDTFYEKYPNSSGIIELSRVGFNNNFTQALLYYGKQSGLVEGDGYLMLLDKEDDKWIISEQAVLWVS